MKIRRNQGTFTTAGCLKPGEVYRLSQGEVVYMATFDKQFRGSNAVCLEKGYKTTHKPEQRVVRLKAELMIDDE